MSAGGKRFDVMPLVNQEMNSAQAVSVSKHAVSSVESQ